MAQKAIAGFRSIIKAYKESRFNLFLSLAWRNIWRNKRRTIITIAAVVFSVTLAIYSLCLATGEHEQMINDTLDILTGHLQVHAKGYWDDRTIYTSFETPAELKEFLENDDRVAAVTERISVDSLISSDTDTTGVALIGINPETEFTSIKNKMKEGDFIAPGDLSGIVIGETLAKNLKVGISDPIIILSQAYDGSIANAIFYVTGIFRTGSAEIDRSLVFINLEELRYLFYLEGKSTELAILLNESRDLKKINRDLVALVNPDQYEIMPWQELMPELIQFVELDNAFGYIFFFMILIVVIFGIVNTILMAVMERYREFGVMMAIGTKPREIISLVLMESALIGLFGIVIGDLIGFGIGYYSTQVPLDFSAYSESFENFGIDPLMYGKLYVWMFYVTDLIIFVSTILASIYPAIKAARLKPVKALRYI